MHDLPGARRVAGLLLVSLLAGCGSGGGDESVGTTISTNAISFSAAAPDAATPASQVITATFGSDIANLSVVHSGNAVANVSSVLSGRTAQITVEPVAPASVGPGAFIGAVAVTGYSCADSTCSKLSAGSTSTVAITYQVSPVVQQVTPYVATAGVADSVVIRGVGLTSFATQGVRFGDTAATASVNIGPTEVRASYPALAAGSYPVRLDAPSHQGPIPTTATLLVLTPTVFAATTLPPPAGASVVNRLIYDAERGALLTVSDAGGGSISRYVYSGGAWGAPISTAGALRDAALSANGTQVFAISATSVIPVDPVTLALGTAIAAPSMTTNAFLKNVVVGSDNRALITTGINASTSTAPYIFTPSNSSLLPTNIAINNGTPTMAANNAVAVISQGDPSATTDLPIFLYSASSNAFTASTATSVSLRQNGVEPAVSRNFSRFALNGLRVFDAADQNFLGTLPATTAAVVFKPDGTRAYTYDATAGGIVTYDTSVDRQEAAYAPLAAATPLAGNPGTAVKMIISPDGGTLFLAGTGGVIVVQPTPAL